MFNEYSTNYNFVIFSKLKIQKRIIEWQTISFVFNSFKENCQSTYDGLGQSANIVESLVSFWREVADLEIRNA